MHIKVPFFSNCNIFSNLKFNSSVTIFKFSIISGREVISREDVTRLSLWRDEMVQRLDIIVQLSLISLSIMVQLSPI